MITDPLATYQCPDCMSRARRPDRLGAVLDTGAVPTAMIVAGLVLVVLAVAIVVVLVGVSV